MTEPIDQATKDLIEKEAKDIAGKKWFFKENADRAFKTGYVAGATVWAEKLKQERNKAIDECINTLYKTVTTETTQNGIIKILESLKDKSHE